MHTHHLEDQKQRYRELEAMREDEDVPGAAMMTLAAGHKRGSAGSEGMAEQLWRPPETDSRIPDRRDASLHSFVEVCICNSFQRMPMEPGGLQVGKGTMCSPSGVSLCHIPWWNFRHSNPV